MPGRVLAEVRPIAWMRRVVVLGATVVGVACASPTLPLPPPIQPTVSMGSDADHVKLSSICGGAEGGAIIIVENSNTAVPNDERIGGAVATPCGSWDATVYAHHGDVLNVSQESGTDVSPPVIVQIP
jgi:hypothetical protein